MTRNFLVTALLLISASARADSHESLWIEAEHLDGIRGYCWPMGRPEMKKTDGHWALSGPGWAAEWNQGGESGFLSIATAANDDRATASKSLEIPVAGSYFVWVRYGDWREKTERFAIRLEQPGRDAATLKFGEQPVVEEDNEMKLYWGWAFGWGRQTVDLKKGAATLTLQSKSVEPEPRQIDVIVLTTDPDYRPLIKDRPRSATTDMLNAFRRDRTGHAAQSLSDLPPLARRTFSPPAAVPADWKIRTHRDQGFLYLWNVSETGEIGDWLGDDPQRVLVPYNLRDKEAIEAFKKKYGGQAEVPIFSDPRIVPTFHGAGPGIFATDPKSGEVNPAGQRFAQWLEANPKRQWAMLMNYHPGKPIGEKGVALFNKFRDRYVGSIAGESLGYFYPQTKEMQTATAAAKTRRELVAAFSPLTIASNSAKYQAIYGRELDANPFADVISCLSVGNITFAPLLSSWGCRTLGYESSASTASLLGMRWSFMRGIARQGGHQTATYRSSNFGDSATMFSNAGSYHGPQNIFDNYYSVYSGSGVTWYKFDLWYQYMAGSSMFYHEQGFDEFWRPGGTSAAGVRDIELSPKGKLVDRFLRLTAAEPERGVPFTPVAILVDHAHGWEPSPYWPNSFKNWHQQPESFRHGDHERMLEEIFWTAFHPIGPESEKPITGTNEVYVPGIFGDVFDVLAAYPDASRWKTIDHYPVVIAAGEIELSDAEGQRLADYVERGGTLLVFDSQFTGTGSMALKLPSVKEVREASGYRWRFTARATSPDAVSPSQSFRFRPIVLDEKTDRVVAETPDGQPFCVSRDRGQGRLVYLSVPRGCGIDRRAIPVVPKLMAHLTRGLMPVEVDGDVEWLVNRSPNGWLVTLLNPAGQAKPQQGITPTNYLENRRITVRSQVPIHSARDRLSPDEKFAVRENRIELEVPAGGVRILDLR